MNKHFSFSYRFFSVLLLAAIFAFSLPLEAARAAQIPPQIFTYQGRLTNGSGTLLTGTYYFKFSIWTTSDITTGTQLWPATADPTSVSATVTQGVFTVNIGDTANGYPYPLNLDFSNNTNMYLQVRASSSGGSGYETLSPRQQITSAAFAQIAGAVVGTTTPSFFGTTTPVTNSFVTIAATSTNSIPLSIIGALNQVANLFQIQNSAGTNLFSVNATGGVTAVAATTTSFFSTTASSTNLFTSNLSVGSLSGFLKATAGAVTTALVNLTSDVTGILPIGNGGTGTSTAPVYGQLLVGNANGTYTYMATSTLGLGGSSGTVSSVGVSGGTTGLTTSGGPITSAGTITLAGTLNVANGGTGWANIQTGAIPYGNGTSALATTTTGTAGYVLAYLNGIPTWTATSSINNGVTSIATTFPLTGGTITTTGTLGWGGLATSSPLSAASGLLYATGVNTLASISTSTAVSMSITGNAATVTTNANLSGAVVSSGSNATTFGSAALANSVLANNTSAAAVPAFVATSTLYGAATGGQVLGWNNNTSGLAWVATSTSGGGTVTAVTATAPLFSSGGATPNLTWTGLATTTQPASSNLLISDGASGVYGVGTSTLTATGPLTGSFTQLGSGGSLGCTTAASGVAGCLSSTAFDTFNNKQAALATPTWPVILTGTTLSFGGLATSSPLSAASGLLYATGVNTLASISTSTAVSMSITGNAATVTTNANLSGAVVSSGSNATTFGSAALANSVLANNTSAAAVPAFVATSTLYGAATGGQVLGWNNNTSGLAWVATSTAAGTVTSIATTFPLTGGTITTTGTLGWGGLATSSPLSAASGLLYATGVNTLASISTSTAVSMSITGNAATVTTNANLSGAVVSSGSNATTFGSAALANSVLANSASGAAVPAFVATSTLYGAATGGQVLGWNNNTNGLAWVATSTSGGGTVTAVTATAPLFSSGGATPNLTWTGLATTSQPSSSNLLVSDGASGVFGVGTSTLTATGPLTGSFTQLGSGGSLGCTTAASGVAGCLSSTAFDTFNNKQAALATPTWPVILTGTTLSFGGLATSSPLSAASGLLYATGVNTLASISTSTAVSMSITGNAATVTTNANLSGAVVSSGSNATTFGSAALANSVLANNTSAAAVPAFVATSTLYGIATGGQVLGWNNNTSGLAWVATSSAAGTVTSIATTFPLTGGTITTTGTLGWGGLATSSPLAAASGLLYATGVNTLASISTSTAVSMSITGNAATVTTNANLSGAVVSSGSNATTFGSAALANSVLANSASGAAVPAFVATSTLYGAATGGQVLGWNNNTSGLAWVATSSAAGTVTSIATTFPLTGGTITTTGTLGWGGLATSSPLAAASGLLYATGVNTLASISTSTAVSMSITGNAATVTTNANLSGAVVSSGSNATTFGSAALANSVLANNTSAAAVPAFVATSTLYGAATGGQVLGWNNNTSGLAWVATSTSGGGVTAVTGSWPIISSGGATPDISFNGLSTSTAAVVGNLPYFSGVNTFANVATTTLTLSGFPANIPAGYGKLVGGSDTTFTWWGLATTSQPASSNLLVSNGTSGVYGVATSSLTATGLLSISNSPSILGASGAVVTLPLTKGNFIVGNDAGVAQATSTIFISSTGNVGISTTSPFALLSVHAPNGGTNSMLFAIASSTASATTTLFSVDRTGLTTVGDTSGTGDSNFQFATDADAWDIGYNSTNKSFNIASSTGFSSNVAFTIAKGASTNNVGVATTSPWRTFSVAGTVALNGLTTGSSVGNAICLTTSKDVIDSGATACTSSSIRFKENVQTLPTGFALDELGKLHIVSFDYKPGYYSPEDSPHSYGMVAEEVQTLDPNLVDFGYDGQPYTLKFEKITGLTVQAIQELHLDLATIASTTASSTPVSQSFASDFFNSLFAHFTAWFADATNGIADFFANRVHTKQLCLTDSLGEETCITKTKLDGLLSGAAAPTITTAPTTNTIATPTTDTAITTTIAATTTATVDTTATATATTTTTDTVATTTAPTTTTAPDTTTAAITATTAATADTTPPADTATSTP